MKQYDAIIIGFGKGGKTLAAELAKRKLDVAVVERSERCTEGHVSISVAFPQNIGACGKACGQRRFLGGQEGILSSVHCKEGRGRLFPASEELSQSGRQSSYNGLYGYRLLCRSGCGGSWDGGRDITIASSPDIHQYGCRNRHSTDRGDTR